MAVKQAEKRAPNTAQSAANKPTSHTNGITSVIAGFGEHICVVFMRMISFIFGIFKRICTFLWERTERFRRYMVKLLATLALKFVVPFVRFKKGFVRMIKEMKTAKEQDGKSAIGVMFSYAGKMFFGKKGLAATVFNYALPVVSIVFLLNLVAYANNMVYAVRLSVNGEFMGYIESEAVFDDAEKIMQQRITYLDDNAPISFEPTYSIESIGAGEVMTKYKLADKLLQTIDAEIEYAYGLYIGNSFYGALADKDAVERTLEGLLSKYRTGIPDEEVEFVSSISYEPGLYLSESIVDTDGLINLLTSEKTVAAYYTVVEGDAPLSIADKLGMSLDELEMLNPGFTESLFAGDQLMINRAEPFLAVSVTRTEVYDKYVDYETEYYDDSTRYVGTYVVTQEGEKGVNSVTAKVSYVNGYETRRKVISTRIISAPTTERIATGTKPTPSGVVVNQQVAYGEFFWPVGGSGGYISEQMYGYGGYYGHSGIDIAAPYGTPIYAGEGGTVTYSGWYSGYGKCVIIQHASGLKTLYAHASALFVVEGQTVTQGEYIADVGMTGIATGYHLHFEVISGTSRLNPINYLPYHR